MLAGYRISLVMPCRNEAEHLPQLIAEVPDFFDEIICVSNKSTDSTVEVGKSLEAENPRFKLLQDDRVAGGIGYGYAHMTGIQSATGDVIVCADADGTYPVEDTPQILDTMKARNLRFV